MSLTSSHAFVTSHRVDNTTSPRDGDIFTADDIGAYLGIGASSSGAASTADSKATSAGTQASVADSKAVSDSINISVALSTASAGSGTATSTADSKGVSAGSQATIADSKAVSDSVNCSIADSKAESVASALVVDVGASVASSKADSSGTRASTADSKAVSDSLTGSTADSKGTSAGAAASVADSKAISVSGNTSTADSKAISVSGNTSIADSKAVSVSVNTSIVTSKAASIGSTYGIVAGSSGTASTNTSSLTEVNLAAIKIPAGLIGANGSVSVEALFKMTGTTAAKAVKIRLSTSSGDTSTGFLLVNNAPSSSNLSTVVIRRTFWNSGSASAQICADPTSSSGLTSNSSTSTGAINTANDSWININGNVGNAGDALQLVGYTVTVWPGV